MANRLFFLLMGGSSVLALARAFMLAGLLIPADFGRYSILIALAMFLSTLPGLGLIEETRKSFPRLFIDGQSAEISGRADHVARLVASRMLAIGGAATLIAGLGWSIWWGAAVGILALIAFGNAWASIMASALRAGNSALPLGVTSFIRASITLPLTVVAALDFGLIGALVGEALGALLGAAIMRAVLSRASSSASDPGTAEYSSQASRAGLLVFFGSALVSAPIYLNRPVAALAMSATEVGTLSLLLVLVGALQTTIAVCDQAVGPRLVHWQHAGMVMTRQKRRFFLVIAGLSTLSLAVFGAIWIVMHVPFVVPMVDKYALTGALLFPAALLAALSITSTADWMLQAHNREQVITVAAAWNLGAFGVLMVLVVAGDIGMEAFVWGLALAKLSQLGVQLAAITRLPAGR